MAKRKGKRGANQENVIDYRHKNVTRLNIPPAGLVARGQITKEKKITYAYNPHLSPLLRFDTEGKADRISNLIAETARRKLETTEIELLNAAFSNYEPWLEWAGKREQQSCVVDPVALHIHERISTQAILRVAKRQDLQRSLFADPDYEYHKAVQFYKYPMDWANRMILGDSLAVMASLARREAMAGKVQMIYMDPPYGIKYASNFQPEVGRRDVKDRNEDLTREPEMVKAYRDTWTLGVHSYLSYLRDRLLLCRELLADTGSIFVQIGDDNMHTVRDLVSEVFRSGNFIAMIAFKKKKMPLRETFLFTMCDYLLWFSKDKDKMKFCRLFLDRETGEEGDFNNVEFADGRVVSIGDTDINSEEIRFQFQSMDMRSSGRTESCVFPYKYNGREFNPSGGKSWKTNPEGMRRLDSANRLYAPGESLRYKLCLQDYPVQELSHMWMDTQGPTDKQYVVQTSEKVVERCLLMTTDPGDLVLDPTCGGGTTAYMAEHWGRRWITIDISRVALAIARQRLLTAKFDYYQLRPTSAEDVRRNPDGPWLSDPDGQIQGSSTFEYKTVPHLTLKSIAQNRALDPIFDKWRPALAEKLAALNSVLKQAVTKELRYKLLTKLDAKAKREGKKAITEADQRRWKLPEREWQEREVPFDTDADWPKALQDPLNDYRKAWRQKMDEVNACIAARADQEELVDKPVIEKRITRVSGPFTMEGIIPAEESIDTEPVESPIGGAPEGLPTFGNGGDTLQTEAQNTAAYLDRMVRLMRDDGVRFPDNKIVKFIILEALSDGSTLHARGTWGNGTGERQVAVIFGPQYGSLSSTMVEDGIRTAARRGFDDLVFAAFSVDGAAQAIIQEDPDPQVRIHLAQIRPDVNMGDLLKTTVSSQIFTVSGSPRTSIRQLEDGEYVVTMEGVDIYDPVTNTVRSTGGDKVAAWFVDSDYDGRCFCVCQAFFPDKSAWEKLGKALRGTLDEDAFDKLSSTESLPFPAGEHKRIAVKVIDPRGNEVLRVHKLGGEHD